MREQPARERREPSRPRLRTMEGKEDPKETDPPAKCSVPQALPRDGFSFSCFKNPSLKAPSACPTPRCTSFSALSCHSTSAFHNSLKNPKVTPDKLQIHSKSLLSPPGLFQPRLSLQFSLALNPYASKHKGNFRSVACGIYPG